MVERELAEVARRSLAPPPSTAASRTRSRPSRSTPLQVNSPGIALLRLGRIERRRAFDHQLAAEMGAHVVGRELARRAARPHRANRPPVRSARSPRRRAAVSPPGCGWRAPGVAGSSNSLVLSISTITPVRPAGSAFHAVTASARCTNTCSAPTAVNARDTPTCHTPARERSDRPTRRECTGRRRRRRGSRSYRARTRRAGVTPVGNAMRPLEGIDRSADRRA